MNTSAKTSFMNSAVLNKLMQVATIHEYAMVTPELARVTVTHSPGMSKDLVHAKINAALKGAGKAVSASFRPLTDTVSTGFVSVATDIRHLDSKAEIASSGYRVVAKNLYMDDKDKTLWDVKSGAGGTYLSRNGSDNLEGLIQAARVSPTGSTPRLGRLELASAKKHQLVAFVVPALATNAGAQVDYGFCVETAGNKFKLVVEAAATPLIVDRTQVVATYDVELPKSKRVLAATDTTLTAIEYYKQAFSYAPDYVASVIKQIEEMASF